jgi:tRNA modification GTPase
LVDTAGIRASDDEVEREGVMRARGAAGVADLVVLVLDRARPLEDVDCALLRETASSPRLVVVNKIDLAPVWQTEELGLFVWGSEGQKQEARNKKPEARPDAPPLRAAQELSGYPSPESRAPSPGQGAVLLSLKTGAGLDELRAAMREALDVAEPLRDAPMVTNVRHEALLRQAREAIARARANLEEAGESASEELVLADLSDARGALEEVTGKRTTDDLLRRIFERFCIGK